MKKLFFTATLASIILSSCSQTQETNMQSIAKVADTDSSYVASINQWHATRLENLQKEDGWLALAGLYWLEPGENTFGSGKGNKIVFPEGKVAAQAGSFVLDGDMVKLQVSKAADVTLNGEPVQQQAVVYTSGTEHALEMRHGSLKWVVIKRGDKYGVRLWDAESEAREAFDGIERYPVLPIWKLEARLEQNPLPKQILITNVLGQTSQEPSPGAVVFTVEGKDYRLDALEEGEELFIIFADKTNGTDTYGSGRYLYMPKPDTSGKTFIDFNKAYTPPCAFTGFATCPLPPKQNFLSISITAGEKSKW
ncbi:DUF1684 domain-containing protein [uncultured Pontibacter sp.]|uniref:DUF1684 domain-containing protein n=1 Tax=uncultured Pontibacter sp. TaxID=453356 RepID=UPI002621DC01|nr:DUF1684 domain-containing protein [uncultured Pontibacter sp.]